MKQFLFRTGKLLLIILTLVTLISLGSMLALSNSCFYKPSFLVNGVSESQFDYIVLGASEGLTTIDTKQIDDALQLQGINLSMDDTSLSSQYLMLQHFLKEGKTTQTCILVSNPGGFNQKEHKVNNNDYRFMMFNNRDYVNGYFKQFTDPRGRILYYSKWIPFLGASYYNSELFFPSMVTVFQPQRRNRFDDKGNYTYPVRNSADGEISDFKESEVNFSSDYFDKIARLCEDNNIRLICYLPPNQTTRAIYNTTDFEIINHSDKIKNFKYFYDERHVNSVGRTLATQNFIESFKKLVLQQAS